MLFGIRQGIVMSCDLGLGGLLNWMLLINIRDVWESLESRGLFILINFDSYTSFFLVHLVDDYPLYRGDGFYLCTSWDGFIGVMHPYGEFALDMKIH